MTHFKNYDFVRGPKTISLVAGKITGFSHIKTNSVLYLEDSLLEQINSNPDLNKEFVLLGGFVREGEGVAGEWK